MIMTNRHTLAVAMAAVLATTATARTTEKDDVWAQAATVVAAIEEPRVGTERYVISDFGASQDADALTNGSAIDSAIVKASGNGGGEVVIPAGEWLTGPITLLSGVNLVVEEGATLKFSTVREHYLPVVRTRWEGIDCYNLHPLIYANDQHDIAITGKGTIDGQASIETWWHMCGAAKYGWKEGMLSQRAAGHGRVKLTECEQNNVDVEQRRMGIADGLRPQLINFYKCERVKVEGVTLRNSPFWVIHPTMVNQLIVRGVTIISHGPNSDGCDPESSKNVLIEDCFFDTGDDCIAIKSGRNNDGRMWNIPSENIVVRNCRMKNGHGGIVVGSEITGGYRNLWVENCEMDSPELDRVVRIKTNPCRGGVIENIYVRNINVGQCREAVLKINLDYEPREECQRDFPPVVQNVQLSNIKSQKSRMGVYIVGLEDSENVHDISLTDCHFDGVAEGNKITGKTSNIVYKNLYINGEKQK